MQQSTVCDECGWKGRVLTGWVPIEEALCAQLPPGRLRKRGQRWYYRRRLRDLACPRCHTRNLHAGRALALPFSDAAAAAGHVPLGALQKPR
jgi:hypothetical protein